MEFLSSLSIFSDDKAIFLEKRIELLEAIERYGSMSKACSAINMSYKNAWDSIDAINNLSPKLVVQKETGGKGGGGTTLTEYGKNLITSYKLLKEEHNKFLAHLTKMTNFDTGTIKSLGRINMQISARNQIQGIIEYINETNVNAEVFIKLKSGYTIVSVVTMGAVKNLDLKVGDSVVAICKSSSVLITTEITLSISARNKLQGTIVAINSDDVSTEVILDLGNETIASVITTLSIKSLGLKVGDRVSAIIKATDVMIGK